MLSLYDRVVGFVVPALAFEDAVAGFFEAPDHAAYGAFDDHVEAPVA